MATVSPNLFCAGDLSEARILVVGHDRRLRRSATLADAPFFGDYFLKPVPTPRSELAKYNLAEALFGYVGAITSYRFPASSLAITNLCNLALPHAPSGRVVLIPEDEAKAGVKHLESIVKRAPIKLVLAMSEQVNYWLQKLGFTEADPEYIQRGAPKGKGIASRPPYYEPRSRGAFPLICGRPHNSTLGFVLYPIVHVRSWPFDSRYAKAYGSAYSGMISDLKSMAIGT